MTNDFERGYLAAVAHLERSAQELSVRSKVEQTVANVAATRSVRAAQRAHARASRRAAHVTSMCATELREQLLKMKGEG